MQQMQHLQHLPPATQELERLEEERKTPDVSETPHASLMRAGEAEVRRASEAPELQVRELYALKRKLAAQQEHQMKPPTQQRGQQRGISSRAEQLRNEGEALVAVASASVACMTESALAAARAQLHEAKLRFDQAEAPSELFENVVGMLARIDAAEAILRRKADYYVRFPVPPPQKSAILTLLATELRLETKTHV
jgi:hypothetical protein